MTYHGNLQFEAIVHSQGLEGMVAIQLHPLEGADLSGTHHSDPR
jgi:hypothetical protein